MTASAHVIQLVRSHYAGNAHGFASSAMALARASKVLSVRNQIEDLVRHGLSQQTRRPPQRMEQLGRQAPPTPAMAGGMFQPLPKHTFDELLLHGGLQAIFDEILVELEYRQELAERGLRARDRILLHGPPGNGKTSSAAAIAEALDVQAFGVSLPQLVGMHIGETGQNLGRVFSSMAEDTVVVFDEIDAIGSTRTEATGAASKEMNSVTNTMLTLLDRNRTGIIVATTNRLDILDPALVRRFEEVLEVPAPTADQKRALAKKLCDGFQVAPVNVDDCPNFDAVTKRCQREARRLVMQEILAAENAEEEQEDGNG